MAAHPSLAERAARGRAARASVPRSSHADWGPAPDRRSPEDVLLEQAADRVPELVPIRHGRMLASPFAFFRGAAALMAADLAGTPDSGIPVQLCGDAHLSNFGGFAAPDRELVFDMNDFDETRARPVGVGRQAAGRQHLDGRPRARPFTGSAAPRRGGRGALVPRSDAGVRRDAQPRALVRAARRRAHPQPRRRAREPEGADSASSAASRARGPRTTCERSAS